MICILADFLRGKQVTLLDRARLVGLTAAGIARETGLDRMTVHRCLEGRRVHTTTRDAVEQVLIGKERHALMRLLKLHELWLRSDESERPQVGAAA